MEGRLLKEFNIIEPAKIIICVEGKGFGCPISLWFVLKGDSARIMSSGR